MGQNSKIEWTDHTFNPWYGCTKVSEACKFCYAEKTAKRLSVAWGPEAPRRPSSESNWKEPLRWQAECGRLGVRQRVFSASLADLFDDHPSVSPVWRHRLWDTIQRTPNLDWLLLTKRPENWQRMLPITWWAGIDRPPNIRLGVTIENDERAQERGPYLHEAHARGWPTFVSYEPALGLVNWTAMLEFGAVHWLISGGESGAHARPSHPDWFRAARDAAAQAGVPFLHKQNGEWLPGEVYSVGDQLGFARHMDGTDGVHGGKPDHWWSGDASSGVISTKVGKKAAGRLLDGIEHNGFPR